MALFRSRRRAKLRTDRRMEARLADCSTLFSTGSLLMLSEKEGGVAVRTTREGEERLNGQKKQRQKHAWEGGPPFCDAAQRHITAAEHASPIERPISVRATRLTNHPPHHRPATQPLPILCSPENPPCDHCAAAQSLSVDGGCKGGLRLRQSSRPSRGRQPTAKTPYLLA